MHIYFPVEDNKNEYKVASYIVGNGRIRITPDQTHYTNIDQINYLPLSYEVLHQLLTKSVIEITFAL